MNGVHDLGGMHGFGPVVREPNEPVFHADWERRTLRLRAALLVHRSFNGDEFRHSIERMAPAEYLATTYYEHWLHGIERLLLEKGVVTAAEVEAAEQRLRDGHPVTSGAVQPPAKPTADSAGESQSANPARASANLRHDPNYVPRFHRGDRVIARNTNPEGHTRLPRYARGKRGVIREDWGVFVFPDTHAHGRGANPQHCYSVEFNARELWGADHSESDRVCIDLWEDYLEPDAALAAAAKRASAKPRKPRPAVKQPAAAKAKVATPKARTLRRVARKAPTRLSKKTARTTRKPR
jgi:nitrile hydratase subunit beta